MKKILLLMIIVFMGISVYALGYGDVNNDGIINSTDYVLLKKYIMKKGTLTDDQLKSANINKDKTINSQDYILIKKKIISGDTTPELIGESPAPTSAPTPTSAPAPTSAPTPTTPAALPTLPPEPTTSNSGIGATTFDQVCDEAKTKEKVDYADFASFKQDGDDYYVMKAAHDCANKYGLRVSVTKGTYHVYKRNLDTISVQTNTNFNGSTIYIHDDYDDSYNYVSAHLFTIQPSASIACSGGTTGGFTNAFTSLVPASGSYYVYIEEVGGAGMYGRISTPGTTDPKTDSYLVADGVVQNKLTWDYNNSTINYMVCPVSGDQLTFKDATFKTVTNPTCNSICQQNSDNYIYIQRGIAVTRSNTKVSSINHIYVDSSDKPVHVVNHRYSGFFTAYKAANVTFDNCKVHALECKGSSGKSTSTYDISLEHVVSSKLKSVKMNSDVGYNQLKDDEDWGVMGAGNFKNLTVDGCELNRIDAHRGVYDLTVKNSTIGVHGITVVGTGVRKDNELKLSKVTLKYTGKMITLRHDYGTSWNGTIKVSSCKIEDAPGKYALIVNTPNFDGNMEYAYPQPIYNPSKITIDGLSVSGSKVASVKIFNVKEDAYNKYYLKHFKNDLNKETKFSISGVTGDGSSTITKYNS